MNITTQKQGGQARTADQGGTVKEAVDAGNGPVPGGKKSNATRHCVHVGADEASVRRLAATSTEPADVLA